jgi:predicted ATP-grasp superfamily ATP-dependent carboligase
MFDLHVRACRGRLPRAELAYREGTVVYGLVTPLAPEPLVLGDTRRWLRDPALRDVPPPHSRIAAETPICTVFAEGRDITTCRRALARRAAGIYEDARASRLSAA